ncbi:hypothetical protein SDC9_113301 [bioreactor metagenome]|uniref:Uncharacterized protein n=1 Tax=bioreactor metagenome TaxID=1076179 RepID=A0A645BXD6_9ZZZZ
MGRTQLGHVALPVGDRHGLRDEEHRPALPLELEQLLARAVVVGGPPDQRIDDGRGPPEPAAEEPFVLQLGLHVRPWPGQHDEELPVAGGAGGVEGEAAGRAQRTVEVVDSVDGDRRHQHRHRRAGPDTAHQRGQVRGVVLAPVDHLAVAHPERADRHPRRVGAVGGEIEGQRPARVAAVLVDVPGVEQPLAAQPGADVAHLRIRGELDEGRPGTYGVPGQVVHRVRGAGRDAPDPVDVDARRQQLDHRRRGEAGPHAATLEDQRGVGDSARHRLGHRPPSPSRRPAGSDPRVIRGMARTRPPGSDVPPAAAYDPPARPAPLPPGPLVPVRWPRRGLTAVRPGPGRPLIRPREGPGETALVT